MVVGRRRRDRLRRGTPAGEHARQRRDPDDSSGPADEPAHEGILDGAVPALLPFRGFLPHRATPLPGAAPTGGADSDRRKETGTA